ncbi:probable methyltransferase-like protein 25 isoform X2 [Maniola jurtina]|uniref:probable methyltransferase-like protein 25 isoform X2 n=1 Tax=Maniola jurtina TaxID=191418 RepID=UPI001E687FF9|nr:probable methyltransferase-like protein 25 isoform X2 [Maniola jurtina]
MALPTGFEEPDEYFEEFFNFLHKYEYLFNFPNTDLLVNNALDKIELDCEDINMFSDNFEIRKTNFEYLTDIFENLDKLTVKYDEFIENENLEFMVDVPLSTKKKHEIAYLAKEIENVCKTIECDTIVDFGSGLGYLDEQLFKTSDFNVLGLECNEANYVGAKKRQRKYHVESIQRVKYIKHTINTESYRNIKEFVDDKFPDCKGVCITGLHACADLTVDAINIFLKMEQAGALVIMPCCYHRIIAENGRNCRFKNFPLSKTLKEVCEKNNGFKFLTVPFLRLATQPPNVEDAKLEDLVFNLLARAVLQAYASKHNCKLKRTKRKAVRLKTLENNFEAYAVDAVKGFKLIRNVNGQTDEAAKDLEEKIDNEELFSIWRQMNQVTFKKAAIFVLLQNSMQPVFENLVLYDRLVYLHENGIENCTFNKIVNAKISPRCLALVACKVQTGKF